MIDIASSLQEHLTMAQALHNRIPEIEQLAVRLCHTLQHGGKILWMGNGGSAADCQHLAAELVGRFRHERRPLASIALTTDTSILTAVGNDYGFETIFLRQILALCQPQDAVVGISTSGNSPNVASALRAAKEIGAFTALLTGRDGGNMRHTADIDIIVPAQSTARIQEGHILIGHILCDWIESAIIAEQCHV
jgi:D-sedoheptulose 7-phosphate isomerase